MFAGSLRHSTGHGCSGGWDWEGTVRPLAYTLEAAPPKGASIVDPCNLTLTITWTSVRRSVFSPVRVLGVRIPGWEQQPASWPNPSWCLRLPVFPYRIWLKPIAARCAAAGVKPPGVEQRSRLGGGAPPGDWIPAAARLGLPT